MKKLFLALFTTAIIPIIARADGTIIGGSNPPGTGTSISSSTFPSGATNYIQNTQTLQTGATFFVSSGTANNFNSTNELIGTSTITTLSSNIIHTSTLTVNSVQPYLVIFTTCTQLFVSSSTTNNGLIPTGLKLTHTPASINSRFISAFSSQLGISNDASGTPGAGIAFNGSILGGATYGDCEIDSSVVALGQLRVPCSGVRINAPGSISSGVWEVYLRSDGTRTATLGIEQGSSSLCLTEYDH